MGFKTSIICSTYNDPKFLEMVLDSLLHQTSLNFELVIADDGSNNKTRELIEKFTPRAPFPVKHIWHEDKGWRKAKIHNKAISTSIGDLLIFVDGDCILAPCFVDDHQKVFMREKVNYVLMGRRIELGEDITSILNIKNYKKLLFGISLEYIFSIFKKNTHGGMRKFSLKNKLLRKLLKADEVADLIGANFSLPKAKLLSINGFNEDTDPICGSEDGDIFVRLRNTGTKIIGKKYFAPMFHKFHSRSERVESSEYYQKILKDNSFIYASNGIVKK